MCIRDSLSTDRAFGGLLSGSLNPIIGVSFNNASGGTITALAINYTGEQWRLGTLNRTDSIDFQYSTTATSLTKMCIRDRHKAIAFV